MHLLSRLSWGKHQKNSSLAIRKGYLGSVLKETFALYLSDVLAQIIE